MTPVRIFISSVQSEFAQERAALRDHILGDEWMQQIFEVFLFEDAPASDQRPDALYIEEVTRCDIYIGLFGLQYGSEDEEGVSPTEREFNHASKLDKYRLIYVKNVGQNRDPRMTALIDKAEKETVRKSFETIEDLRHEIRKSLFEYWNKLSLHPNFFSNDSCRTSTEAEETLRHYREAFCSTYTRPEQLIPFKCRSDEGEMSSRDVSRLISDATTNILICGPSGCGKTLLASDIALKFSRDAGVAITIPVKNYSDRLAAALDHEVHLMDTLSTAKLLSAAQRLDQPILLIVDGYNECDESVRESLTIELSAWARRYEAKILITSQISPTRSELLKLRTIEVLLATMETKIAIAKNIMGIDVLPKEIEPLLGVITTGLEASLVGEVGQQLRFVDSRFALFDAYVRKRLQDDASDGIRALSHVAAWLCDRLAFSMSVRDLDRLMGDGHIPQDIPNRLQNAGLLSPRGDRVSFVHEMFFNAFAAEAVVRRSTGRSEPVLTALAAPVHAERKDFIIGAIDDQRLLEQVLDGLSDPESVTVCLSGSCGRRAQEWAEAHYRKLLLQLRDEVRDIRFKVSIRGFPQIVFDGDSLTTWTTLDRAFLAALPKLIGGGHYLDDILNIIGTLDRRIDEETNRLRSEAEKHNIPLRSAMFEASFVFELNPTPAIAQVCVDLHSVILRTNGDGLVTLIEKYLRRDDLSYGQLYLLLRLLRLSHGMDIMDIMTPFLARTIKLHWIHAPYHLALELMFAVCMCNSASETHKAALIQVIESLPQPRNVFLSTAIVDALKSLGALEQSEIEYHSTIHEEISRCLANPNENKSCAMAYSIYSYQFDHPFSNAYREVLSDLPDHERKLLLMMAVNGAKYSDFFLDTLIANLASYKDPEVGKCLVRFTELPPTGSSSPQNAVGVFVSSHIALAKIGLPLPDAQVTIDSPCAESLAACGIVLYWINRDDLDEGTKRSRCRHAFSILHSHREDGAFPALFLCDPGYSFWVSRQLKMSPENCSIASFFPDEVADLCRYALNRSTELTGYFRHFDRSEHLRFAIDVLARHGKNADLSLLRQHVDDRNLGTRVIEAMKMIEERFTAS